MKPEGPVEKREALEGSPQGTSPSPGEEESPPVRLRKGTVALLALFFFALAFAVGGAFFNLPYLTPLSMVLLVVLLVLLSRGVPPGEPTGKDRPEGPSRSEG